MENLVSRIKSTKLVGDQMTIAAYLTQDIHKTAFLTSAEIADACKVSASAVTRLAQKLGYNGFPELKKDLEALYRKQVSPLEAFESFVKGAGQGEQSAFAVSLAQDLENLQKLNLRVSEEDFNAAIRMIAKSEKIYLVGIGQSETLVDVLASFLDLLGKKPVKLKSFGVTKQAELISFSKHDLVIGFSFQRIVKEVRDVLSFAKASGSKTLAVTDSETNPLSVVSDCVLVAPVVGSATGMSLVAPLSLVNSIASALAMSDQARNQKRLQEVKKEWDRYPIFCD